MTAELQAAIEQLYVAFGDAPRPLKIEACPCCTTPEEMAVLLKKPLREITPEELSRYASKAFNTVGDVPDFLYLLPRILEIAATEPSWWPDVEIVLPNLNKAGFSQWPAHRREAVRRCLDAAFDDVMNRESWHCEIGEWICALGLFLGDVTPYLQQLETRPRLVLAFYEDNSGSLQKGRLSNAFWDVDSHAYQQVLDWFNSSAIKKMIHESYGL